MATAMKAMFFETSAMTGANVHHAFHGLATAIAVYMGLVRLECREFMIAFVV